MIIDGFLDIQFPYPIFSTFHRFDNYYIDDMQCGDLDDRDFQKMGLKDISARVDPFKYLQFDMTSSLSMHAFEIGRQQKQGKPISRQLCAGIMFDEMKELSTQFAGGLYAPLISKLIDHFHYGNGEAWSGELLNRAYDEVIRGTGTNDVLIKIWDVINHHLFLKQRAGLDYDFFMDLRMKVNDLRLPKFNRFIDRFNGLGISIHDIYAQEIKLMQLRRYATSWEAQLFFKGQDHFGLGIEDITRELYRNFRFFRIWFFLQRHRDYAYKPFMTNFNANISIDGGV